MTVEEAEFRGTDKSGDPMGKSERLKPQMKLPVEATVGEREHKADLKGQTKS